MLAGWRSFADHYPYGAAEVRALREQAEKSGAAAAVTTAKDAVRLPGWESRLPLYVLDVSLRFTAGAEKVGEMLNSLAARGLP